ncbi:hypothetical protein LOZ53_005276 [Ophidiomyces ophidiicola]|uniref:Uncharacterized protein n=1 Tax=Ophidiomyces ophidiicola TaxID=1387563 RepID=A0ACB8V4H9_9EURO|nr:uncharacterized protein LOZ57_003225 [Ophidiomyces ophidiicola]KAI1946646.1 hypothetical protein LOZ62_003232 [Ophidiomyces ophidiicola]KAI1947496.1 hypothetical protein LOZ57_003225 [Ophidiomyces ophidiicola]KAI1972908.1 hypothetical protein LOZ55_005645 [Ophidiomyces ophidiicola]KAI1975463.1 hypothetical protein LOZ56_000662 [Ophidiomyces ophidiicola]KAI1980064.1 hypothetical protein LOZ54_005926 [Ophidiomyces ophidiicola]
MPSNNFEKSVKGATKSKLAAPKSKYIEHILTATYSDAGVAELFRALSLRLRDSTWTVVFKSLIVIHMMIREGSPEASLRYLSHNPRNIAITSISDVQIQGGNIWRYSEYLIARALAFSDTKTDFVRGGQGRLKKLTVDKGLLRETEIVQKQIRTLLKCDLLREEPENEISLTAFRLLTLDLLALYSVMNEGTINVLEHYFEMSRPDSERALQVYKSFSSLTEDVVRFLRVARQYESATRLEIPNLKHASTDLTKLLEDDLNDPDFAARRKEYREQKYGKSEDQGQKKTSQPAAQRTTTVKAETQPTTKSETRAPAPDLIDFFDSIEQNQQPMNSQPVPQQYQIQQAQMQSYAPAGFPQQQMGFAPQQTGFQQGNLSGFGQQQQSFAPNMQPQNGNPFAQFTAEPPPPPQLQPIQPNHTGAGFGGYTPQPQVQIQSPQVNNFQPTLLSIPQNGIPAFQQPMQTGTPKPNNPFRQSMLISNSAPPSSPAPFNPVSLPTAAAPLARQPTNPFAKHRLSQMPIGGEISRPSTSPGFQLQEQPQPLRPQRTGTNPFARSVSPPNQSLQAPAAAPLRPNPTGSTNPFRQSAFINQQTGQPWQVGVQQGTMGGLENLPTVPIFPRPGQTT